MLNSSPVHCPIAMSNDHGDPHVAACTHLSPMRPTQHSPINASPSAHSTKCDNACDAAHVDVDHVVDIATTPTHGAHVGNTPTRVDRHDGPCVDGILPPIAPGLDESTTTTQCYDDPHDDASPNDGHNLYVSAEPNQTQSNKLLPNLQHQTLYILWSLGLRLAL